MEAVVFTSSYMPPTQDFCRSSGLLAIGGKDVELRLHEVATGVVKYTAKGAKPNKVGLTDKPWNTAVAFLPAVASSEPDKEPACRLVVGTAFHKVRLYDTAAGPKPQMVLKWEEGRITALSPNPTGKFCYVANGMGQIATLNMEKRVVESKFRGSLGSVRSLSLHPAAPLLAAVGLDRTVRLFSTSTRELVAKAYVKSQLVGKNLLLESIEVGVATHCLGAPEP